MRLSSVSPRVGALLLAALAIGVVLAYRLRTVTWQPHPSFTDRLQIHFSLGQAF